jgi:hypothetical protein
LVIRRWATVSSLLGARVTTGDLDACNHLDHPCQISSAAAASSRRFREVLGDSVEVADEEAQAVLHVNGWRFWRLIWPWLFPQPLRGPLLRF